MPVEMPPSPPAVVRPFQQAAPQPPLRIPDSDIVVEVVGELPLRTRLEDVTQLLGQRAAARSGNRAYPTTILELIMLVKSNPAKPPGRAWNSIRMLTIGYDPAMRHMMVEYCLDYCDPDPRTGAPHPRRKMVSYSASEQLVVTRLNKKLKNLKKYERPPERDR